MADEVIMNALWRDGYHAAARLIEALESSINRDVEFSYLKAYAQDNYFGDEVCRDRLRALWTAYCFHQGLVVDTRAYNEDLSKLWEFVEEDLAYTGYAHFSHFMCEFLV